MNSVVIIAPFFEHDGHVGNHRVARFVRWLSARDVQVVVVRAGSAARRESKAWGEVITVADRLGLYRDVAPGASIAAAPAPARKPNRLRRFVAYAVFNPDPGVVWARDVVRDAGVRDCARAARFVLSSSPPESSHVASWRLARASDVPLVIDMRDGWLDEPLKPLLRASSLQRWREGRMERRILRDAATILVTSSVWRDMLVDRLPEVSARTCVLTNGYPPVELLPALNGAATLPSRMTLVHAGRFSGSSLSRTVSALLAPIHRSLSSTSAPADIVFIGRLDARDLEELEAWRGRFEAHDWRFDVRAAVPRDALFELLTNSHGLLLMSASQAAIPSKLFEYLKMGRPVLAVTPTDSAVWRLVEDVESVFRVDGAAPDAAALEAFLAAASDPERVPPGPERYAESSLGDEFADHLAHLLGTPDATS